MHSNEVDLKQHVIGQDAAMRPSDLTMVLPSSAHRIAYADALRTFAIFSVVVCHIVAVLPHTSGSFAAELEEIGGWGVGCFFVLTGFLLARPYIEALLMPDQRRFPSTRLFLARRFYRIFPLYAFAVVVTALGGVLHRQHITPANVLAHLTFLHGFIPAYDGAPFGPLWTMAVDAQFYVLLPLAGLVLYAALKQHTRATRLRTLVATLVAAMLVSLIWRLFVTLRMPIVFSDFNTSLVYERNVIGMGASFALGIGLSLLEVLRFRPSPRICAVAVGVGVALIGAYCLVSIRADRVASLIIGDFIAGLSAVFLLGGLIEGRFTALSRIARSRTTSRLAALSYAVYLFHKPVIVAVHDSLVARGVGDTFGGVTLMIVASIIVLAASAVIGHRFVELPFLRMRDKRRETPTVLPEAPLRVGGV